MIAIISFLIVLLLSFILVRIGAILLKFTGLSYDVAKFQAASAFTGTGYSTQESEMIMSHPVRRKIITFLMVAGPIGFISFCSSLILSFLNEGGEDINLLVKIAILTIGIIFILLLMKSQWFDHLTYRVVAWVTKRVSNLEINDYDGLLNISGDYTVAQYHIQEDSWIEGESLERLQITSEGILILGIRRADGYYVGTPQRETVLYKDDEVIFYGKENAVRALIGRKKGEAGNQEHQQAIQNYTTLLSRKQEEG